MNFEKLSVINVNEHIENKNGLAYLSWVWAWSEIKKQCPDANYEIEKFENNLPYTYKVKEYKDGKWTGGYIEKSVEPATMFDINKTIMRCLVKKIVMFGIGIYIYG